MAALVCPMGWSASNRRALASESEGESEKGEEKRSSVEGLEVKFSVRGGGGSARVEGAYKESYCCGPCQ
jgi:hypothetical protein